MHLRPVIHRLTARPAPVALMILVIAGCISLFSVLNAGNIWDEDPDSAFYITEARSVLRGDGLKSLPYSIYDITASDSAQELERPDALFPPGFPIAIAATSFVTGAEPRFSALWLNRLALAFLPIIIFLAFRQAVGVFGAACLGILGGTTTGALYWGALALTDTFSLAFVVACFGLTLSSWSSTGKTRAYLLAAAGGVFAASAYAIRNVHLALMIAVALSMAYGLVAARPAARGRALGNALAWAGGAAAILVPLFVHNLIVFGTIQPYALPPGDMGLATNIRWFIVAQVTDILGSHELTGFIAWSIPGSIILLIAALVFGYATFKCWPKLNERERAAFALSILYAVLGTAIVIAARTIYQWGELINVRHAMQYSLFWFLPIMILLRRSITNATVFVAAGSLAALLAVVLRLPAFNDLTHRHDPSADASRVQNFVERMAEERSGPCATPNSGLVLSNYAFVYRIVCNATAFHLAQFWLSAEEIEIRSAFQTVELVRSTFGGNVSVVALHPGNGIDPESMPLPDRDVALLAAQGWMVSHNSRYSLVAERFAE